MFNVMLVTVAKFGSWLHFCWPFYHKSSMFLVRQLLIPGMHTWCPTGSGPLCLMDSNCWLCKKIAIVPI